MSIVPWIYGPFKGGSYEMNVSQIDSNVIRVSKVHVNRSVTHLSESGGTFMDARLTWVRLKAELKNWRKVGRESLTFL